ncbi:uncharacterized protein TrAFT101_001970 [Trichoderma asperellum]|uniref:uncharacterized protein n=1 Tax=Trichoderma asperellum TaxID=101201 RepID=UPI0033189B7D|nr:hypothetical protein TrAFT101_001970 [Trichoderma asperellum]
MNYRETDLEISIEAGSGIDLGWISSTKVSLLYDGTLIGEASLKDNYIIPNEYNMINLVLQKIEIRNMIAFKALIRHVIPQPRDRCQLEDKAPSAALEILENGHTISMVINLDNMGVAKALDPIVRHIGDKIEITFVVRNPTNVIIFFDKTHFKLQKDGRTLATLEGTFFLIGSTDDDQQYVLTGNLNPYIRLFGTAVLKGVCLDEDADTWFIHAIRQFEMEINLDNVI